MITNKDIRVEGSNIIINGEKHPIDPALDALIKRANTVQGKLSALDTKITAIEALEKSASGNPISLTGVAEANAMALSMTIEPIQSGSGDPSPTNVRPISGLTEGTVQTTNGTDTNTATITFGQTVYGGTVNFKTGEVTVTHGIVDLGMLNWSFLTDRFVTTLTDNKPIGDTEEPNMVCSSYPTMTWYYGIRHTSEKGVYLYNNILGANDSSYTDAAAFKTAMSGVHLCYELATPSTLTLTPAELELLKGNNTITANGVLISIEYIGR